MTLTQTRRRFLKTLSLAGAAGFVFPMGAMAAERALETASVRLPKTMGVCVAPQYIVEDLLRAEGFTDIRYVDLPSTPGATIEAVAHGETDFNLNYAINYVSAIDAGNSITLLAGLFHNANRHSKDAPDLRSHVARTDWRRTDVARASRRAALGVSHRARLPYHRCYVDRVRVRA